MMEWIPSAGVLGGAAAALVVVLVGVWRPVVLPMLFIVGSVLNPWGLFTTGRLEVGFGVYPIDVFMVVWFVVVSLRMATTTDARIWRFPTLAAVFLFLIIGVLGVARGVPRYGIVAALGEGRLVWFSLAAILVSQSVRSRHDVKLVLGSVLLCALARCAAVYYRATVASGTEVLQTIHFSPGKDAIFFAFAGLAVPALVERQRLRVLFGPPLAAFLSGGILLVQSRSAWIAVVVATIVLVGAMAPVGRRSVTLLRATFVAAIVVVMVAATVLLLGGAVEERLAMTLRRLFEYRSGTGAWRLLSWAAALAIIRVHPIGGEGFGGYFARRIYGEWIIVSPHNDYLEVAAKMGLVGLIVFLAFLVLLAKGWRGMLRETQDPWARRMGAVGLASVVLMAVFITFNAELHYGNSGILLWIMAGLQGVVARGLGTDRRSGPAMVGRTSSRGPSRKGDRIEL